MYELYPDNIKELTLNDPSELVKHQVTDAMLWAESFCATFKKIGANPDSIEPGWMVGWFASAIETTKDSQRK